MLLPLLWPFVLAGAVALQFVAPFLLVRYARWPRSWGLRAFSAVILCWVAFVAYDIFVCCPIGIARAEHLGAEDPERGFDHYDVGLSIAIGWFWPALLLTAHALGRWFLRNYGDPKLNPSRDRA